MSPYFHKRQSTTYRLTKHLHVQEQLGLKLLKCCQTAWTLLSCIINSNHRDWKQKVYFSLKVHVFWELSGSPRAVSTATFWNTIRSGQKERGQREPSVLWLKIGTHNWYSHFLAKTSHMIHSTSIITGHTLLWRA